MTGSTDAVVVTVAVVESDTLQRTTTTHSSFQQEHKHADYPVSGATTAASTGVICTMAVVSVATTSLGLNSQVNHSTETTLICLPLQSRL